MMCLYEDKVDSVSVDNRQEQTVDGKRETNHHLGVEVDNHLSQKHGMVAVFLFNRIVLGI